MVWNESGNEMNRPENYVYEALPVPGDPFNDKLQQFGALRQMGYPVDLVRMDIGQAEDFLKQTYGQEPEPSMRVQTKRFRNWYLPVVEEPEFAYWVDDIILRQVPDVTITQQRHITNHPAVLARHVSQGYFRSVNDYIERTRKGAPPVTAHAVRYGATIMGCYLTAMDRYAERGMIFGEDFRGDAGGDPLAPRYIVEKDRKIADSIRQGGFYPTGPEAIGALVADYYTFVEGLSPTFAAFKRTNSK
ncbi:MAG: hypothetical protein ABWX94_00975 [Candidatus Saccharimonadales bacterium]